MFLLYNDKQCISYFVETQCETKDLVMSSETHFIVTGYIHIHVRSFWHQF